MALLLQHTADTFQWGVWKSSESVEELLTLLPHSAFDKEKLDAFTSSNRKLEWLSVRVLLYQLLGEEKQIEYESDGKPHLADRSQYISISHTRGYVAVILSTVAEVGIDIEHYGQRIHKIVSRFMRDDEKAGTYDGDITWGLLLHWSAKEALFKCVEGSEADLQRLRLEPFEVEQRGTFGAQEYWTEQQQFFFVSYLIHPDFVLTWLEAPIYEK